MQAQSQDSSLDSQVSHKQSTARSLKLARLDTALNNKKPPPHTSKVQPSPTATHRKLHLDLARYKNVLLSR